MKTKDENLVNIMFLIQRQISYLLDMIIESSLAQVSNEKLVNLNPLRKNLLDIHVLVNNAIRDYQNDNHRIILPPPKKFNWQALHLSIIWGIIGGCSVYIAFKAVGVIP